MQIHEFLVLVQSCAAGCEVECRYIWTQKLTNTAGRLRSALKVVSNFKINCMEVICSCLAAAFCKS